MMGRFTVAYEWYEVAKAIQNGVPSTSPWLNLQDQLAVFVNAHQTNDQGKQAPFHFLHSTSNLLMDLAGMRPAHPQVIWVDNEDPIYCSTVFVNGGTFSQANLRVGLHAAQTDLVRMVVLLTDHDPDAIKLLQDQTASPASARPFHQDDLHDDKGGRTFLTHPDNKISRDLPRLIKRLAQGLFFDEKVSDVFKQYSSTIFLNVFPTFANIQGVPHEEEIVAWCQLAQSEWQGPLAACLHLVSGQPGRAPEVASLSFANAMFKYVFVRLLEIKQTLPKPVIPNLSHPPHRFRDVINDAGRIVISPSYSKSKTKRVLARYPDDLSGALLAVHIALILPLLEIAHTLLHPTYDPTKDPYPRHHLFVENGVRWNRDDFRAAFPDFMSR